MKAIEDLKNLIGNDRVITDPEELVIYGQDWTRYYEPQPLSVVFPKTTEEVQKLVKWANQTSTALVPSGGRTGLSGGAVAAKKEVVVCLEKMNEITDFNPTNMTVDCQAGAITETLQKYVADKGYLFPVDFASRGSSQIGGNIATNAGGIKVVRYGLMRDWVASLTVVTGTGEILKLNQSLIKNATGYDLRHLFIGSEGTLGFITEATLKVTHPPKDLSVFVVGVPTLDAVMSVFDVFRKETDLMAFELYTDVALDLVLKNYPNLSKPFETPCPVYLLIEFENGGEEDETKALEAFEKCVEKEWILDGVMSQSETQAKDFWAIRENIAEAASGATPYKNDISVTIDQVPRFMNETDAILKKEYPDFDVVWFGHIGDGNLHISILKPAELDMNEFIKRCQAVDTLLFDKIKEHNGSVSAEHGVGLSKKPFLHYTRSPEEIEIMRGIKKVFDPNGVINPGKVFD